MTEKKVKLEGTQVIQAFEAEQAKLRQIEAQKQQLQQLLSETAGAEEGLKEIQEAKKEQKIMVSLGGGVYAEAKLESAKTVKTGLGEGVLISTPLAEALKQLAKRKEEMMKDMGKVQRDEAVTIQNLNNLGAAIESARKKQEETNTK